MEKAHFCRAMYLIAWLSLASFLPAQSPGIELANLREDVRLLTQRVGELQLQVEQLQHQNQDLQGKSQSAQQSYATVVQLNEAVASLSREIKTATANSKNETLQQVGVQIEKLARQSNTAIESLAKNVNPSHASPIAAPAPTFSEDYKKEGITYTVVKGDTLGLFAKKTGAASKDIVNANKLTDPSKIHAGQTLFIPGGKP